MDGFGVVEEAATDVIALWQANGIAEPWRHADFIDAIVSLQQARERQAACRPDLAQFHDRSAVCTAALADYLGVPRSQNLVRELDRIQADAVFDRRVLFLQNLGFVTPTEARRISYEETLRFEQMHARTYRELGFQIVLIAPASVQERVREIKRALSL